MLDIVSQKGLVRRELEPVDPRRVTLVLTPEGEAVVAGLNRSMRKLFREGLDYEPPSPWERLNAVLDIADELSDDFDALSDDF
ncbi:winged helix-turn-helix transcriptional regulator [Archangium gephyra]|nr:winged helix-turn-helix transcriptional regulator [Archangium gephyra]